MLIHLDRPSHILKHLSRAISLGIRTRPSHPDTSQLVRARNAEGAQVVHGDRPGVVVVAADAGVCAGGGRGGEGGGVGVVVLVVMRVVDGASVHVE